MMILEFVIPGLVVMFVGAAALIVAGTAYLGFIEGWIPAFTLWFVSSLVMVLGVRTAVAGLLPASSIKQLTDEDIDAYGEEVDVIETVTTTPGGRIRFRGSTWAAQTLQEELPVGSRAKVVARDNLVWIVEPLDGWAALEPQAQRSIAARKETT